MFKQSSLMSFSLSMKPLIDAPPASSTHVIYLMGPVSAGFLQPFASSFIAPWVNLCIPDYQLRLGVDPLSLCQAPDLTFTLSTYQFHHGQLSLKLYRGSCLIPSTSVVLPLPCSAVVLPWVFSSA
ncbi:hypothetical protein F2P79_023547 [Pimephales promelas]|nr:hypothetical protein F2P79_023547 [Pimephales promelas]